MAFARTETSVLNHPKFVGLDPAAIGLWTLGNAYCWDQLTDGFIPDKQLPVLLSWVHWRTLKTLARKLQDAGLWDRQADGWQVHDWLQWNPPAAIIKADREAAKARARKSRESRGAGARAGAPGHASAGARAAQRPPERAGARAAVDVEVDVDSPPTVPPTDPSIPHGQRTDRTIWTADGYPRAAFRTDCPDDRWRLKCIDPAFVTAHPQWKGRLPEGKLGTCPHHRAKAPEASWP